MFIFQKDSPTENLQEKKLQVLKHLIWWNKHYSIEFDEEDQVFREDLLRRGVSYCWLGVGMLGIGSWNLRWMLKQRKITSRRAWKVASIMFGMTALTMSRFYFALKFDGLDYVAKKYALSDSVKQPKPK